MIDTHCHLDHVPDRARALDNDLIAMVTVGTTLERSLVAVAEAEREPRVFAAVGVHPTEAALARDGYVRAGIEALADHGRVVAIGETGVDLYWDRAPLSAQLDALAWQVELAARTSKPVVLHVRDADASDAASREAARAIAEHGYGRGILHCTNGHRALLATGLELGWFVSFAGNVTYPKATAVRDAATWVPQDRLLVETDSPYLAPVPLRGQRNVPGNVTHTALALAALRGLTLAALEPVLDANAIRCYGLPLPSPPGPEGSTRGS